MKKTIKTLTAISLCLVLASSCNEKKTKNNSSQQNDNDAIYDSLSTASKESKSQCDSLRMKFEEELSGANESLGYGPTSKKLQSQIDSCESKNQRIKVKLDSVFILTSKEFKVKHYKQALNELDAVSIKNKNILIKSKERFESEVKGAGMGVQAMKLKNEILQLENQIQTAKIAKDSINELLINLK